MSKINNKDGFTVGMVIFYIVLIVLCFLVVSFVARYTNNFTDDFKNFYVSYDDSVCTNGGNVTLSAGENSFNVGYSLGFIDENNTSKDFSVKAVSVCNDDNAFTFTVDGEKIEFEDGIDFTNELQIEKNDGGFTIIMPASIESLLALKYPDSDITVIGDVDLSSDGYFKIVVSSYNDKNSVEVFVYLDEVIEPDSINFNYDRVIF